MVPWWKKLSSIGIISCWAGRENLTFNNYWCDGFSIAGGHIFLDTPLPFCHISVVFLCRAHNLCTLPLGGVSHCSIALPPGWLTTAPQLTSEISPLEIEKLVGSYLLSSESLGNEGRVEDFAYIFIPPCPIGSDLSRILLPLEMSKSRYHSYGSAYNFKSFMFRPLSTLSDLLECRKYSGTKLWFAQTLPTLVHFSLHYLLFILPVAFLGVGEEHIKHVMAKSPLSLAIGHLG